jgi:hypothetical protein
MSTPHAAEATFQQGMRSLPAWNDAAPDVEIRRAAAMELIREAAEQGHLGAMEQLADGMDPEHGFMWATRLAARGVGGPLVSALTGGDWPVERCVEVLTAAQAGVAWAQLAVGEVYGLGMRDFQTGTLLATVDGAFGWLPGVADPRSEGRAWKQRAAAAGWAPAAIRLADELRVDAPEEALT